MKNQCIKAKLLFPGLLFLVMVILISSCSKYDDGPFMSLYSKEKRVQGRWYFSNVKYNDVDSTDSYRLDPIQAIEFGIPPDGVEWGSLVWFISSGLTRRTDYGYWQFNEEMDSIRMITTVKVYSEENAVSDSTAYYWKVNRLAYTEFWLERMANDTTKVVWKLWKNAY